MNFRAQIEAEHLNIPSFKTLDWSCFEETFFQDFQKGFIKRNIVFITRATFHKIVLFSRLWKIGWQLVYIEIINGCYYQITRTRLPNLTQRK